MVIIYDLDTKQILYTEDNVNTPVLPLGTIEEKKELLKKEGKNYISIEEELGVNVLDYKLKFDDENNFIGLQKKEVIN